MCVPIIYLASLTFAHTFLEKYTGPILQAGVEYYPTAVTHMSNGITYLTNLF